MNIIRDCLDKQLVDRHGKSIGRVDGIVMHWQKGRQPTLAYVEMGAATRAHRLHRSWGRFIENCITRWSPTAICRSRIAWTKVVPTGVTVTAAVEANEVQLLAWELWLRKNIVARIPGA